MAKLLERAVNKLHRDGVLSTISAGGNLLWSRAKNVIKFQLYKIGVLDIDDLYSPEYYESMSREAAQQDAQHFAEVLIDVYDPMHIVDLGCGTGRFLKEFHDKGIDTYGVDGSQYAVSHPVDNNLKIEQHDLTNKLALTFDADVALCIEVLEHIPKESAITVAKSIRDAAPIAVVTMAEPGQGGTYHVNEQPLEYWKDIFRQVGMEYHQSDTILLRKKLDPNELSWLEDNIAVFYRQE